MVKLSEMHSSDSVIKKSAHTDVFVVRMKVDQRCNACFW